MATHSSRHHPFILGILTLQTLGHVLGEEVLCSRGGKCVPYYQCLDRHQNQQLGVNYIDLAGNRDCPGLFQICCQDFDPGLLEDPRVAESSVSSDTLDPLDLRGVVEDSGEELLNPEKCGIRNSLGLGASLRGLGGDIPQFGEWPHVCMVMLVLEEDIQGEIVKINQYKCGASLITPTLLLTAAHCIQDVEDTPETTIVRCGEWNTQEISEPLPHQDREVETFIMHPRYNTDRLYNDFALVFTYSPFILANNIRPICLPPPSDSPADEFTADQRRCFAAGWGKDGLGKTGRFQTTLKQVELNMMEQEDCQNRLREARLGSRFNLHKSFVCAGGLEGIDTCKGDGGSPLVCQSAKNSRTYEQVGIVSWGVGCGEAGVPGVYSRVSSATCWIDYTRACRLTVDSGAVALGRYTLAECGAWVDTFLKEGSVGWTGHGDSNAELYTKCRFKFRGQ